LALTLIQADSITTRITTGNYHPNCPLCGSNYYTSNTVDHNGDTTFWNNGNFYFMDPLPQHTTLTGVVVTLNGLWGCSKNSADPVDLTVSIQGTLIGSNRLTGGCTCNTCNNPATFTRMNVSFPNYKRGMNNTVTVNVGPNQGITLTSITLQLIYASASQTITYKTNVGNYHPTCSVCGSYYWTSSDNSHSGDTSEWNAGVVFYNDTLSQGCHPTRVQVNLFGLWGCGRINYTSSDILVTLQSQPVQERRGVSNCNCNNCGPIISFDSGETGKPWSYYRPGEKNSVQVLIKDPGQGVTLTSVAVIITYSC